ncbi:hypothetical protein K1T73_01330 [Roseovarius sp. SCSIO 43702]|uniref:hypothetical protein n=1 Tax=Roseovarius sp. SCSIO 43702 TaxID=2823043 RepID=UPI001C736DBB|nr:hypothetical protein [Roseovarius sp. SCSIO 43702]QYX57087.1 hypothetical protein K1T73_01330 [Roseovarius sp. SCSIO 43702]
MMRWLLAFLLIATGGMATSQTVEVRSGAHRDFTRLVLHLPRRVSFTLARVQDHHRLEFDGTTFDFNTANVFDRIDRSRISSVMALDDSRGLALRLSCDCVLETAWVGQAMLALDIRDTAGGTPRPSDPGSDDPARFSTPLPAIVPDLPANASSLVVRGLEPALEAMSPAPASLGSPQPAQPDLLGIEGALVREIARASGQGLLTIASDKGAIETPTGREVPGAAVSATPPGTDAGADSAPGHVRMSVAVDDDPDDRPQPGDGVATGEECPDATLVDLPGWGGSGAFSEQIAAQRALITAEFDRVDEEEALALARLYLHFGFGVEARHVLRYAEATGPQARILADMGEILESGHVVGPSPLKARSDCGSDVAFWSVLADDPFPREAPINEAAVLQTFHALPPQLMDYLGPILAQRLSAAGRDDLARRLLRRLDHTPALPTGHESLLRADLESDPEATDTRLAEIATDRTDAAPLALLRRFEGRISTGRGISEEMTDLLASYAVEFRDHAIGPELARAHVEALAAMGDFDGAFAQLAAEPSYDVMDETGSHQRVLELLTLNAEDVEFIAKSTRFPPERISELDGEVANAAAERHLALGFPELAARFVSSPDDGPGAKRRKLIRARVALAMDRPRNAEVELLGLEGDEVNVLRAQAREMAGEPGAALDLYASGGRTDDARRLAVETGSWSDVARHGERDIADLATAIGTDAPPVDPEKPLTSGRALLEESSRSRQRIGALLEARTVSEEM